MSQNTTEEKELTREQKLNKMRLEYQKIESLWIALCAVSLIGTFVYLFFVYKFKILASIPILRYGIIAALLILIFFCIYMLPVLMKKNKKYRAYSQAYKKAYVKPILEEAFGAGSYSAEEKVSIKEITEFSMLKKAKSALANDCVRGEYKDIPFLRYDLTLRYDKRSSTADCVLIAMECKTHLHSEVQIVQEQFKIGGAEYEQPENFCKILSGKGDLDKRFHFYAEKQKDGEDLVKEIRFKDVDKLTKKNPVAIFFDQKKVYLVIKRDKDVMEAPIYRPVKEERSIREAGEEVELIRSWITLIKSWTK